MKKRIILWIALLPGVAAQAQTLHRTECPLGYDQYIGRVWRENLSYAAEKLNVRIADAEVKAAAYSTIRSSASSTATTPTGGCRWGRACRPS